MSDHPEHADTIASAWQRWRPEALAPRRPGRAVANAQARAEGDAAEHNALATALAQARKMHAQALQLHDDAKARGHEEGYAQGHALGLREGTAAGHQQGYDAGYQAGLAQGREDGAADAHAKARQLASLADGLAQSVHAFEAETGEALVSLAIRIAEQVLHSTLDMQPEKILDLVRDVLRTQADPDALVTVRLHPDDAALVREHLESDPSAGPWRLMPDETIARGGCIANTVLGSVDATLATRWQRVLAALGRATEHDSRG
ncbi:flagellar assembly protein FliH [Pusillimonas sp. TS35]|uniref:flagellar assembly protein FliH n=1 Tax=Paracandidimonas lactea TaxID=2895524 RepID=UPI00136BC593|nr:flagellar assembly protein FliH [Paracandidimonas lactea]MYN11657.1 flagellar assembly protein FliH [Pusillimonas sp. TS35]